MSKEHNRSIILTELIDETTISDGLVAGLNAAEADALFSNGRKLTFAIGDHVFQQGEPHSGIYIIMSGIVRVYYAAPSGREITLAHWSPPNFVGGPELFGRGEHLWSGVALEETKILAIPGPRLRNLALSTPKLAVNLLDGLVGKARCYSLVLQMLGTRSVIERLAYLILTLSEVDGTVRRLDRHLSHASIASVIGSTRQWVSMALERFRKKGFIGLDEEGRIVILKLRELEIMAQVK